jgi:uncharacterized hydantoinase/oxoprolinase family protein
MGVATRAPFRGQWVSLAREYLATMADVRRILGEPLDDIDLHATADGKGKTLAESTARLARMLGRDRNDGSESDWGTVAAWLREEQLRSIEDGLFQVLSVAALPVTAPVIVAGIGAPDVFRIAHRLGRPAIAFGELAAAAEPLRQSATSAAPAVAVALLAG